MTVFLLTLKLNATANWGINWNSNIPINFGNNTPWNGNSFNNPVEVMNNKPLELCLQPRNYSNR